MPPVIRGKSHQPDSLGFNALYQIDFPLVTLSASETSAAIAASLPLTVGTKIIGATAVLTGAPAGTASFNLVVGPFAYEGATQATGNIVVAGSGNFSGTDVLTATVGGTAVTTAAIPSGTNAPQAAQLLAAAINANGTIAALGNARAVGNLNGGSVVTFVATATGTAGNAITLAAGPTPVVGHLSAVAQSATLSGGAAAGTPVLATPDSTEIGVVPPNTALTSQALFATDQALTMTANFVQSFYPVSPEFDAIFPKNSLLTLRVVTNGAGAGTLQISLLVASADEYPFKPETGAFAPTLSSF